MNHVRDISGGRNIVDSSLRNIVDSNIVDSSSRLTNNDNEDDDNEEVKYITLPVSYGKSSPWWVGFELFNPVKHPTLCKEHVMCKECSTFKNNQDAGIIKVGISQSTSNLRSHKKHHHPAEYETIAKGVSKTTMQSNGVSLPTSIVNMPGFTVKVKTKDAKLLFRTAATTLAIEEGILFRLFSQPTHIHPCFFKAAFLDPRTHHYLKKILTVANFNQVC